MERIKSVSKFLYGVWDKLPTVIKILVYMLLGSLLMQVTVDITKIDTSDLSYSTYADIFLLALHDALVYYAERFLAKATGLKPE